jgi:uncharacterized membrane protein YozB (DUF420 family)
MLYRSFGGVVEGSAVDLSQPTFIAYFAVHGAVAAIVMALEIVVLALGIKKMRSKTPNKLHGKLAKVLFGVWWFAFLTGEIFYIVMYLL